MTNAWTDLVTSNPVFGLMDDLGSTVDEALALDPLPEAAADHLRRMDEALANIRARLKEVPAALVPVASLNNGLAQVQSATGYVRNFINDRSEGHLHTANGHIDNLIMEFRWLTPLSHKAESAVLVRSAEKLAATVDRRETETRKKLDDLTTAIDNAASQTQANLQQATQTLETLKASAEASVLSLTTRIDGTTAALSGEITAQKSRLDTYFEQQQAAHLSTQQEWQREFTETLENVRQTARTETDAEIANVRAARTQFQQEADQVMESLKEQEQQAKKITGVTAAAGVTGAYIKEADEQRGEANTWRIVASAVLVLLVLGATVTTIWSPLGGNVTTQEFIEYALTRAPFALVLGGVITYAARESGRHRSREQHARRRAMELTAFRPFIGELEPDAQRNLIVETTRKYFRGDGHEPSEASESE